MCIRDRLGGDDFDMVLVDEIKKKIQKSNLEVKFEDPESKMLLKKTAESIKKELSFSTETSYSVELPNTELTFDGKFKLEEFENLINPMIEQTLESCNHVLREAKLTAEQIDEVVLVGGSTIIPKVRKRIESFFQNPPHVAIDPYKVVAMGAGCLLYTSPSPRDRQKSRMPSSA